jgi:DNA primase
MPTITLEIQDRQKAVSLLEKVDSIVLALDPLERVAWEGEVEMLRLLEVERQLCETVRICR